MMMLGMGNSTCAVKFGFGMRISLSNFHTRKKIAPAQIHVFVPPALPIFLYVAAWTRWRRTHQLGMYGMNSRVWPRLINTSTSCAWKLGHGACPHRHACRRSHDGGACSTVTSAVALRGDRAPADAAAAAAARRIHLKMPIYRRRRHAALSRNAVTRCLPCLASRLCIPRMVAVLAGLRVLRGRGTRGRRSRRHVSLFQESDEAVAFAQPVDANRCALRGSRATV